MTFLSILFALVIEQLRPLRADNAVYTLVRSFSARIESRFNAGQAHHGQLGWAFMVLALTIPTALIYWLLMHVSFLLGFLWNVLIVYLTLGLRHYSHYFTSIQFALNTGDEVTARALLGEWTGVDTTGMEVSEISRIACERALITTHRNVFGVFFWFLLPVGPAGAVMYRVAEHLARAWNEPEHMRSEVFGRFAARMFYLIDWMPARLTAAAFAVVGNFEDAIYAWRNFAGRWQDEAVGIILSAGGGALGVRFGTPLENVSEMLPADAATVDSTTAETDAPQGDAPTPRTLQSVVGLIWRALLLCMFLLLLLSVAVWMG